MRRSRCGSSFRSISFRCSDTVPSPGDPCVLSLRYGLVRTLWGTIVRLAEIIWHDEVVDKLRRKHSVEPEEVEEALASRPYFFFAEKGHQDGENVYGAFGRSDAGRYLTVHFIYKTDRSALILSARDMARKDRRRYERR